MGMFDRVQGPRSITQPEDREMNETEIVVIIDRSGSMAGKEEDVIGGYAQLVEDQKKLPGECRWTTVLFDDQYEVLLSGAAIGDVPPLEYSVRGMTALHDAIGRTVKLVGERLHQENFQGKVIVAIMTDGCENASKEYTLQQVRDMITHQESKYGWEFLYFGANQDAFEEGTKYGMKAQNIANYEASKQGTRDAFAAMNATVTDYRGRGGSLGGASDRSRQARGPG